MSTEASFFVTTLLDRRLRSFFMYYYWLCCQQASEYLLHLNEIVQKFQITQRHDESDAPRHKLHRKEKTHIIWSLGWYIHYRDKANRYHCCIYSSRINVHVRSVWQRRCFLLFRTELIKITASFTVSIYLRTKPSIKSNLLQKINLCRRFWLIIVLNPLLIILASYCG